MWFPVLIYGRCVFRYFGTGPVWALVQDVGDAFAPLSEKQEVTKNAKKDGKEGKRTSSHVKDQ